MLQTASGVTTVYIGNYYQYTGTAKLSYYVGGQLIGIRDNGTLSYLLTDHLGSVVRATDSSGVAYAEQRYNPGGSERYETRSIAVNFRFTGQRRETSIGGLTFMGFRWYDPLLNRWTQPDTIVPSALNPQSLNRYSYVLNAPLRYVDPTGHRECDDSGNGQCAGATSSQANTEIDWIVLLQKLFGIILTNDGAAKAWDQQNAKLLYMSMLSMNKILHGRLIGITKDAGIRFRLQNQDPHEEGCPVSGCEYHGWTQGTLVDFYTIGSAMLRQQNIFHEFGHVLDSLPGIPGNFSGPLWLKNNGTSRPSWLIFDAQLNGYAINPAALNSASVYDPNYGHAKAIQHASTGSIEQWADIFANYVAGNINTGPGNVMGQQMHTWVSGILMEALTVPAP